MVTRLFMASGISKIIRRRCCPRAFWEESWREAESRPQDLQAGVIGAHSQRREKFSNHRAPERLLPIFTSDSKSGEVGSRDPFVLCSKLVLPQPCVLVFFSRRDRNKNK